MLFSNTHTQCLDSFLDYRKENMAKERKLVGESQLKKPWSRTDGAYLLFGGSFDGITIGLAPVGSMCSYRSGNINQVIINISTAVLCVYFSQ